MPGSPAQSDPIERHVWVVAGVVILGMIMSILDTTIVNVALATLSRDLRSPISQIQWVVTGYLLSLAAVIPVTGWAARRYGAKRVYLVSIVLFTVGSALCGLATSSTSLIVFRVLQGAGGGMIMPVGQMIMAEVAGPKRMGRVMGVVAMPAMLAPILGPVVGGVILQGLHWSWIFFVNVPIGVLAVVLAARVLPHSELGHPGRLDIRGLLLLATSMPSIVYGLSEIGTTGSFTAPSVIWPILAGVVLAAAFVWHALRSGSSRGGAARPLLDIRLYANRVFGAASFTTFGLGAALFGAMILIPLYYQQIRGQSVILTGLLVGPQGLGMLAMAPFNGRLTDRFGGGRVAIVGVSILCLTTLPLCFVGARTPILAISVVLFLRGLGIGLSFMPTMTAAFASLRTDQLSDATPQMNVLQRLGGAIGTAVLAVVLQRASVSALATGRAVEHATSSAQAAALKATALGQAASAFATTYWWALGIGVLSLIPCIVLLRAETPAAREPRLGATPETAVEPLGA